MKKVISVFLAVLMIISILPISVFAQEQKVQTTETEQEINYNTSNALGEVVVNAINESESEAEGGYGYFIQDVEINGFEAIITLSAPDESTVVVAIFDEESNIMVTSGNVDVDSTTESVTVELAECEMPDYFIVKAFLLNSENEPMCSNYESREYTKAFEDFFEKTVFDFDEDKVINLDYGYETNFAVVSDDAKLIKQSEVENILITNDYENGIYVFENANEEILSLKQNEVLYFVYGEGADEYILTKIGTIEKDNGTVTITSADEFEISDFFSYIKIDSTQLVNEKPQTFSLTRSFDDNSGNEDGFSDEFSISVLKEYESDDDIDVSFSGEFKAKFYLKFYYDFNFGEDYYEITQTSTLAFIGKTEISVSAEKELEPLVLFHGGIPIYAGIEAEVTFSLKLVFSAELSASGSIEVNVVNGSRKISGRADENISKAPSIKLGFDISGAVAFDIIPSVSVGFKILKIVKASIEINAGFQISGTIHIFDGSIDESLFAPDEKHSCSKCIDGDIKLSVSGSIKVSFGLNEKKQKTVLNIDLFASTIKLSDFYISIITENGLTKDISFGLGTCPNIQYKVTFSAIDEYDAPLEGVIITVGTNTFKTDNNGNVSAYFCNGTYSCKAELDDYEINKDLIFYDTIFFAVCDRAEKITIHMKKNVTPNFTIFENMLNACFSWDTTTIDDFSKLSSNTILKNYITDPSVRAGLYSFFSENGIYYAGGSDYYDYEEYGDPKALYCLSYELDADLADWILLNVFDVSPNRQLFDDHIYYYGDKLYIEPTDFGGGPNDVYTVIGYNLLEENKYELTVRCETDYMNYKEFNYNLKFVASPQYDSVYGYYWHIYSSKIIYSEPDYEYSILANGACGDNLTWTLYDNGEFVVSGTGEMCDWSVLDNGYENRPWQKYLSKIKSVNIGIGVTHIGDCSFYGCDYLEEITLPDSLISLGYCAFEGCHSLEYVNIPKNVSSIDCAFNACDNLNYIYVAFDNSYYSEVNGVLFNKNKTELIRYPAGRDDVLYEIPDSVKVLHKDSFSFTKNIESVILSEKLLTIEAFAFFGCGNLSDIVIPNSVNVIAWWAFTNCSNLSTVHYTGTEAQWNNIEVESYNDDLINANITYNYSFTEIASVMSISRMAPPRVIMENVNTEIVDSAVIGNEYIMLIVKDAYAEDLLASENLLYIDQKTAVGENLTFEFNLNDDISEYYTLFYNADLNFDNDIYEHTFGEWVVIKAPTATEEGIEECVCSVCGGKETRTIEKLNYLLGDANGDGKITAADARIILRISAKLDKIENYNLPLEALDVTRDSKLTAADARKVLRIAAKLE